MFQLLHLLTPSIGAYNHHGAGDEDLVLVAICRRAPQVQQARRTLEEPPLTQDQLGIGLIVEDGFVHVAIKVPQVRLGAVRAVHLEDLRWIANAVLRKRRFASLRWAFQDQERGTEA